jgi:hypothetical protein
MTPMQQLVAVAGVARRAATAPFMLPGAAVREARAALTGLGAWALHEIGEHVDLTELVTQVVDLDQIVAEVDVDAVVDRLDLVTIVETVIADIDLPEIIRESTGSMASDTLTGVRMQGITADEAVARAVDRLRPHGRRVRTDAPATVRP